MYKTGMRVVEIYYSHFNKVVVILDFQKIIQNAIDNVITKRLNKLNYVYHIKGKIIQQKQDKEYIIEYNGQQITAFNYNGLQLQTDDVVDVLYSNVDPTYRVIHFKY